MKEKENAINHTNLVIVSMSKTYEYQTFYANQTYQWVECSDIEGTNCYCEDEAVEEIKKRIKDLGAEGIHFLDSGNYHYLTLQWIDKINTRFNLIHFDNHPDLQMPSFGEITSCGGWVQEALEKNQNLEQVYMLGVSRDLLEEVSPLSNRVNIDTMPTDITIPVYITIDKDVLVEEDAVCDWSQGNMTFDKLKQELITIFNDYKVIGVDICGESQNTENEHAHEVNNRTNTALLDLLRQLF